ncbi:N-formylglutamate amidohydrolase [Frigidibacter oleivorans]|uniref:N-formylglutamate amidohydrolase n=1 Tax=Frigidibacter oleivorans TaxID=2487129 RepID=UPI000F8E7D13|nr:N-formylglutamate amidohydrolase [Frigidibacter oleivorans]
MQPSHASPPFRLTLPARRDSPAIFCSPHSGRDYPADFLAQSLLDARAIRSSEDAFVDDLLDAAPGCGAPLLAATLPRAYVDLNRAAEELDPALIAGLPPGVQNPRILSGLGVIPRVVAGGRAIRSGKITRVEAEARIEHGWRPYHACLSRLVEEGAARFGGALLIDVHSMPHEAVEVAAGRGRRPQIVLGDRFGATAAPPVVDEIEAAFLDEGLVVARNLPFAGAYVVQAHGRPGLNRHAVQIEIDRALYMDEAAIRPHAGYAAFRQAMRRVVARIAAIPLPQARGLAAE